VWLLRTPARDALGLGCAAALRRGFAAVAVWPHPVMYRRQVFEGVIIPGDDVVDGVGAGPVADVAYAVVAFEYGGAAFRPVFGESGPAG